MPQNSLNPIIAGYCIYQDTMGTLGTIKAYNTNETKNLHQEAFLTLSYPSLMKGSQTVLNMVSLAQHRVF